MHPIKPTSFAAEITWIGRVPDRGSDLSAEPLSEAMLRFGGIDGEHHGGVTRPSCTRVKALHPIGTTIANTRQLSVLSQEELDATAAEMGLDALDPAWLGASLVLRGLPDLTHLPPSSRLQAEEGGATLVVDMENRPCVLPGRVIDAERPGFGKAFKAAAAHRRGVTAWVEREGALRLGARMRLFVPDQRAWAHLDAARAQTPDA
ncbi:hypothetical protein SAMN04490248_10812 [Salinihabitans flavidus]|uniref:MOSC domain-containing protein n=1 Tax=Salinihabitans flavidus TaxID=569882 RepID=A0A1H8R6F7_9RHOB|nr:MOSC domain-containing protein [Salinihabitans flavidus]SEO61907.1 hypothetical protein SAMN04490248_10812 [Salinihabitans flavidus]